MIGCQRLNSYIEMTYEEVCVCVTHSSKNCHIYFYRSAKVGQLNRRASNIAKQYLFKTSKYHRGIATFAFIGKQVNSIREPQIGNLVRQTSRRLDKDQTKFEFQSKNTCTKFFQFRKQEKNFEDTHKSNYMYTCFAVIKGLKTIIITTNVAKDIDISARQDPLPFPFHRRYL